MTDMEAIKMLDEYSAELEALLDALEALDTADPEYYDKWNEVQIKIKRLTLAHWDDIQAERRRLLADIEKSDREDDQELAEYLREYIAKNDGPPPEAMFKTEMPVRAGRIEYPLDKVNANIWNLLERDTYGQLAFRAERVGSRRPLNIFYAVDFDALEAREGVTITKRLTAYDKRAYIAISALFNAGNKVMTMTQIYYAMGHTGRPGKVDLERINNSITKMTGARIYINNEHEASSYKYARFVYDGSLLPVERGSALVNGQFTEAAIHLFREPPVISFAKERKQITTINVKVLQSPMNKTDQNLLLDDYLIERIARARKKDRKESHRILYKTIHEKVRLHTPKQKQRLPAKVQKYLDHYQKCGMLVRYEMKDDGVTVYFE